MHLKLKLWVTLILNCLKSLNSQKHGIIVSKSDLFYCDTQAQKALNLKKRLSSLTMSWPRRNKWKMLLVQLLQLLKKKKTIEEKKMCTLRGHRQQM